MRFGRKAPAPGVTKSERGFLELTGRQPDLAVRDMFVHFRDLVDSDLEWADSRKHRHRKRATTLRIVALLLTAGSTVVLGIDQIDDSIALPMVALVTVITALETYWSHRPMWVLMEETRYRLNKLRDEMDFHLVTTPSAELTLDQLRGFYEEQQTIWADVSNRWLGFRELDHEPGQR